MSQGFEPIEPEPYPDEWLARIKPELEPGERLLWAGQSVPRSEFSGRKVASIWATGFVLVSVTGFAGLFGALGVRIHSIDSALATIGVFSAVIAFFIFVGVAINILESGFRPGKFQRNLYALTNERAILWEPTGNAVTVLSIPKRKIKGTHRVEYPDGAGTVFFEESSHSTRGFVDVLEARRVEELIRRVMIVPNAESQPPQRA